MSTSDSININSSGGGGGGGVVFSKIFMYVWPKMVFSFKSFSLNESIINKNWVYDKIICGNPPLRSKFLNICPWNPNPWLYICITLIHGDPPSVVGVERGSSLTPPPSHLPLPCSHLSPPLSPPSSPSVLPSSSYFFLLSLPRPLLPLAPFSPSFTLLSPSPPFFFPPPPSPPPPRTFSTPTPYKLLLVCTPHSHCYLKKITNSKCQGQMSTIKLQIWFGDEHVAVNMIRRYKLSYSSQGSLVMRGYLRLSMLLISSFYKKKSYQSSKRGTFLLPGNNGTHSSNLPPLQRYPIVFCPFQPFIG